MDYNMTNTTVIDTNDKSDGFLIVILIFSGLLLFLRCCVIGPICDNINRTNNGGIDKIECYFCAKIFNYFCPEAPERIYTDTDSDSEYGDEDYYYVKDKTNIYEEFINNNPRTENIKLTQKYNNQCTICLEPIINNINDSVVIDIPGDIDTSIDTDIDINETKIIKDLVIDMIDSIVIVSEDIDSEDTDSKNTDSIVIVSKDIDSEDTDSEDKNKDYIILLKCGHSFHFNCIKSWEKQVCPNCKADIEIDSWY